MNRLERYSLRQHDANSHRMSTLARNDVSTGTASGTVIALTFAVLSPMFFHKL